jgi:hypothetical protein
VNTKAEPDHRLPEIEPLQGKLAGHLPSRPCWSCLLDGRPWPCSAARAELLLEFCGRPTELALTMVTLLGPAAADGLDQVELYRRFIVWTPGTVPDRVP